MVRYNNDLDEYESYYHPEDRSPPPPRFIRDDHSARQNHSNEDAALPALGHAASGAFGSALANIATYPLEVISTRLKIQRHALAQRARRTEYQRRSTDKGKKKKRRGRSSSTSSDDVKVIFNVPQHEEKRYRKYVEEDGIRVVETWEYEYNEDELYDGHFDAMQKIYEKEGIGGFYHGVGWDTMGTVVNGFCYFMAYNLLRKQRLKVIGQNKGAHLPIVEELGIGVAAAALSKLFSAPLSNIVTRKQTAAMLYPNAKPPSFADIYHDIMREKGITGFWSGYSASLLLTLNPSITFMLYEISKPHVLNHKGHMDKLDTFILAALCKALATTITYPMNVVRIRSEMEDGGDDEMLMGEMYEGPHDSSQGIHMERGREKVKGGLSSHYKRTIRQASGIVELLIDIVKREGIGALYVGLGGALAKGFFSHGITIMIKEQVHRFIYRLYFFVLDAYNRSEYGSFREKALEKTLHGAHRAGHAAGAGRRKIDSAKEKVGHFGEKVKEKAQIGHHSHSHLDRNRQTSHERLIESRSAREGNGDKSFRSRTEEEMFEEHFDAPPWERNEQTIIREERTISAPPQHHQQSEQTFREERFTSRERLERERARLNHYGEQQQFIKSSPSPTAAVRNPPAAAAISSGSLVGTPPVPAGKTMEKVANWREKVAEELIAVKEAPSKIESHSHRSNISDERSLTTTRHETLEGDYGEHIDRTTTVKETMINHPRRHHHSRHGLITRDPSLASGQSYRSAGARTSLMVHPPSSVRERILGREGGEWVEDARLNGGITKRLGGRMIGGGDVGVNGDVRRSTDKGWK